MTRLVLLACLFALVVSVSAANNWLVVEHCSGDCSGHCGKKRRYITDTCVNLPTEVPSSYKATCTPGGSWKIDNYLKNDCVAEGNNVYGFDSSDTCLPSSNNLPVKFVSSSMANKQVVVKICPVLPDGEAPVCDAETCKEKTLSTSANCERIADTYYYYTVKVTGTDDEDATITLALYDNDDVCRKKEAPVFYRENMRKDECATYKIALRGTCTPITMTKSMKLPPTPNTRGSDNNGKHRITRSKSMKLPQTTTTPSNTTETTSNETTSNETTSSHAVSLATALLSVLAVVVALY